MKKLMSYVAIFIFLSGCGGPQKTAKEITVVPRDISCPIGYEAKLSSWGNCDCVHTSDEEADTFECGTEEVPSDRSQEDDGWN